MTNAATLGSASARSSDSNTSAITGARRRSVSARFQDKAHGGLRTVVDDCGRYDKLARGCVQRALALEYHERSAHAGRRQRHADSEALSDAGAESDTETEADEQRTEDTSHERHGDTAHADLLQHGRLHLQASLHNLCGVKVTEARSRKQGWQRGGAAERPRTMSTRPISPIVRIASGKGTTSPTGGPIKAPRRSSPQRLGAPSRDAALPAAQAATRNSSRYSSSSKPPWCSASSAIAPPQGARGARACGEGFFFGLRSPRGGRATALPHASGAATPCALSGCWKGRDG